MTSLRKYFNIAGIAVFLISFTVFFLSAERTGSLWDCGEFILGAYKLQVVHPPGAPIFLLVGRMFTWIAELVSDNPADIAFAVNLMSGMCTAFAGVLAAWITMMFGKLALLGRDGEASSADAVALTAAGIVGGLTATFCSSIWFSAVEGEVYAMSTFFTALTFWSAVKWYYLPDEKQSDRYLVFSLFAGGLSIGVHLLSLLSFPAIGLLYYLKKYKKQSLLGALVSMGAGVGVIVFIQKLVIVGIPTIWKNFEIFMVNSLGAPIHSGIVPTAILLGSFYYLVLKNTHKELPTFGKVAVGFLLVVILLTGSTFSGVTTPRILLRLVIYTALFASLFLLLKKNRYLVQLLAVSAVLITIAFSTIGTVVIRANADTPVNMNVPSDATRLLPYLNREQYGERPLLKGPHYDAQPIKVEKSERYGLVDGEYKIVDEKYSYVYAEKDKMLFPRVGHSESSRPQLHRMWRQQVGDDSKGKPGMGYNLKFLAKYQLGWMYWRYFMWNFVGKQNGDQGYYPWDIRDGHWSSGIDFVDEGKLYNMDELPDTIAENKARNSYYFLPLFFGLFGLLFHMSRSRAEFMALLVMFVITGIGIIIYSNQPPNEPRERDYIFAGSFWVFSMWVGMGVLALYDLLKHRAKLGDTIAPAAVAGMLALSAPAIMLVQNFDDHSRGEHLASRDYAANFLNSVEPNSILFTYGDNDTYPLWYAQEVEGIRTDVRVVNLSLIAVDWYINKLRSKVNDSAPIKLSLSAEQIRGKNRNQVFFYNPVNPQDQAMNNPMPLKAALDFIGSPQNNQEGQTIINSKTFFIPVSEQKVRATGMLSPTDTVQLSPSIQLRFGKSKRYITKDDLAVMDILANNIEDRPIYFATTCKNEKLLGLNDYMQLEGLALRLLPVKTQSDKSLAIYGSGRVEYDKLYQNVMEKWEWGNFDTKDLFVDKNYMAAVQAMKMALLRSSTNMSQMGDHKRAGDLAKKYFEGFPHMNFPYDAGVMPFISVLTRSKEYEEAKKHMRILAEETEQYMVFYNSLDDADFKQFQQEMSFSMRAIDDLLRTSKQVEDPAFAKEISDKLGKYSIENNGGRMLN